MLSLDYSLRPSVKLLLICENFVNIHGESLLAPAFLMTGAPIGHLLEDRNECITVCGDEILNPRRNLRIDYSLHDAVLLQLAQLFHQHLFARTFELPAQFRVALLTTLQKVENQRFPLAAQNVNRGSHRTSAKIHFRLVKPGFFGCCLSYRHVFRRVLTKKCVLVQTTNSVIKKTMITEYIRYALPANRANELESAYGRASQWLDSSPHCFGYELSRCTEAPDHYILRIHWNSHDGHLKEFRSSDDFKHFYQEIAKFIPFIEEMRHYDITTVAKQKKGAQ